MGHLIHQQRHPAPTISLLGPTTRDWLARKVARVRQLVETVHQAVVRWSQRHEYWPWFTIMALLAAAYAWALLSSAGPFWH